MPDGMGGGDNYVGLGDDWGIDPTTASWMAANQGTPTWDGSGQWDMGQSWWQRNTPSADDLKTIQQLTGGLNTLKPLTDPNAAQVARQFPAVPAVPGVAVHQGAGGDVLSQYLQMLQQRQQQMRSQFMPKTATGLLGG